VIAVYGKRGVGKSSLLRQIQAMALGDFSLPQKAGLFSIVPEKPRRYYAVYYQCDALIANAQELILRLCNDTDPEDGLLRLWVGAAHWTCLKDPQGQCRGDADSAGSRRPRHILAGSADAVISEMQ
jgi:hypothetical protein